MAAKIQTLAKIDPFCIEGYRRVVRGELRWMTMRLADDEQSIVPDSEGESKINHSHLLSQLPPQDVRWIVYNVEFRVQGGGVRRKMAMISWVPDTLRRASLKESARIKMFAPMYSGMLRSAFAESQKQHIQCFIEANSLDEADWPAVVSRASKFEREPLIEWVPWN